jgi:GR25 family glycosyltransferase involved in LPS biosynthesis
VASNLDKVLILEDDVILNKELFTLLNKNSFFPENWEFINFLTDAGNRILRDTPFKRYKICEFIGHVNRTSCYLINKKGAQKLLNTHRLITMSADAMTGITELTGLISYGLKPNIVELAAFTSIIKEKSKRRW